MFTEYTSDFESSFEELKFIIQHSVSKRSFDILFSSLSLCIGLPLFVLIALAIKLTSRGPIFYGSQRMGRGGKVIRCWKFRTMSIDADQKLSELLSKDENLQKEWEKYCKLKNDPRVTWIGKYLRKTSLDEIPQFWNVLKGDLSIVGPRPFLVEETKKYLGMRAQKILAVRPGLTGIWQTSGRNLLTFNERIRLEESYVDHKSFLFDLKIICKTVPILLFQKGAY